MRAETGEDFELIHFFIVEFRFFFITITIITHFLCKTFSAKTREFLEIHICYNFSLHFIPPPLLWPYFYLNIFL